MNRTAVHEAGMLTQCYDNRCLHRITCSELEVAATVLDLVAAASPGETVTVAPGAAHMRLQDPRWGVWTTVAEYVAGRWPLVVLKCDPSLKGIAR